MDTAQYLPMFLAEAREHLQELNLAVVRIEETPDDRETVDEIFRIAHSFKGMSATMGFEGVAAVTHRMEDVFELLKQRSGGLDRAAIDVLLECLDTLEGAVDSIEADGTEHLDPAPLVARLEALVRAPEPENQDTGEGGPDVAAILAAAGEQRIVQVNVTLADDCLMPSVRAYMVLAALAEHGELAGSVPHHDDVETFDGRELVAYLASEHEDGAVLATVKGVPDVVDATAVEPAAAAPAAEPVEADPIAAEAEVGRPAAGHHKKAAATVRVDAERLDQLMHSMGEL